MSSNLSAQIEMLRRQRRQQLDQILAGGGPQQAAPLGAMQQEQQRRGPGPGGPQNVRSLYDTGYGLGQKAGFWGGPTQLPASMTTVPAGATTVPQMIGPATINASPTGGIKGILGGGAGTARGAGSATLPTSQGISAGGAGLGATQAGTTMGSIGNVASAIMPYLQVLMAGRGHAKATRASIV